MVFETKVPSMASALEILSEKAVATFSSDDDSSSSSDDEPFLIESHDRGRHGLTKVAGGRPGLTRSTNSNKSWSQRNLMALATTARSSRNLLAFKDTPEDDPIYQKMQALLVLQKQLGIDKDTVFLAEHDKKAEEKERLAAMTPEERIACQQEQLEKETQGYYERFLKQRQLQKRVD